MHTDDMAKVAEQCVKHDTYVVADEVGPLQALDPADQFTHSTSSAAVNRARVCRSTNTWYLMATSTDLCAPSQACGTDV